MDDKKRYRRARLTMAWRKYYTNKLAVALTALGVIFIALGCFLLAWVIQGQDVVAILTSPLALLWYVIIIIALVTALFYGLKNASQKGD